MPVPEGLENALGVERLDVKVRRLSGDLGTHAASFFVLFEPRFRRWAGEANHLGVVGPTAFGNVKPRLLIRHIVRDRALSDEVNRGVVHVFEKLGLVLG